MQLIHMNNSIKLDFLLLSVIEYEIKPLELPANEDWFGQLYYLIICSLRCVREGDGCIVYLLTGHFEWPGSYLQSF